MERPRVTPEDLRDALHSEIRKHSSGVEWVRWLDASVALRNYSFRNVVLITLQMPYASQVARSDIWQKFGRSVLDQQQNHDIRILAPVIQHRGRSKPVQASDAEFELERGRSARGGGRLLGFKVGSVWDVSQTDGPPLPPPSAAGAGASTSELWRALAHQAQSAGYTLVEGNSGHRGLDGYTDYQARTVVIRRGLDDVSAVARLAHEVAHLRMHNPKEIATSGGAHVPGSPRDRGGVRCLRPDGPPRMVDRWIVLPVHRESGDRSEQARTREGDRADGCSRGIGCTAVDRIG